MNAREVHRVNQGNEHIKKYRYSKKYIMDSCYDGTLRSMWLQPWESVIYDVKELN